MELPGSGLFYALAALSMAFVSFTSIVVVLHQGTGKPLSPIHVLLTLAYCEMGFMATASAMFAPVLAICGIREDLVWRISSALILAILVPYLVFYPKRLRQAAPGERLPLRRYIFIILGTVVVVALCLNIVGLPLKPGPGPVAVAAVYMLCSAVVVFLRRYSIFLQQ
jgi:hydrogenase-4 membrane subunit HyfE